MFDKVDVGDEPERQILHGVRARNPSDGTVAVVLGSGSGRSALARLLLRVDDVDASNIGIKVPDICSVSARSLRQANGAVPQETLLFNDTIACHIGHERSDKQRVRSVVADAAA